MQRPRLVDVAIAVVWLASTAFVAFHHEPWRDEAQSWLLANDLDLLSLLARLPYEGTPPLWFLILKPLAASGAPYAAQPVIAYLFAAAAVLMLLMVSPFPRVVRVLIAFSYYFAYEYTVIARNYAVGIAALVAAAAFHPRRLERPWPYAAAITALALTSAHTLLIAMVLTAMWVIEARRVRDAWSPLIVVALAEAVAVVSIWPRADAQLVIAMHFDVLPNVVGAAFLPGIQHWSAPLVGLGILTAAAVGMRRTPLILAGYLVTLTGLLAIAARWTGGLRHAGLLFLVTLLFLWIAAEPERESSWRVRDVVTAAVLTVSVLMGIFFSFMDVTRSFSGAREAGAVLARYPDVPVAAHNLTQTAAVLPHAPHRTFWFPGTGQPGSYMKWDAAWRGATEMSYPEAVRATGVHFGGQRHFLLLNVEMPDPQANGYRLLYATTGAMFTNFDERFWIYEPVAQR